MDQGPDEIGEAIAHTRDEIAGTMAALGHKLDIKGQAKARLAELQESAAAVKAKAGAQAADRARPFLGTTGTTAARAVGAVRSKSLPYAAGAGVLLLSAKLYRHHGRHEDH
jgi:Protein of unknown function (DUF3618)